LPRFDAEENDVGVGNLRGVVRNIGRVNHGLSLGSLEVQSIGANGVKMLAAL
jgi:hypothetical protein